MLQQEKGSLLSPFAAGIYTVILKGTLLLTFTLVIHTYWTALKGTESEIWTCRNHGNWAYRIYDIGFMVQHIYQFLSFILDIYKLRAKTLNASSKWPLFNFIFTE